MNTQNLTPKQRESLKRYKAQGIKGAHLERIAARYEAHNAAPQALKGAPIGNDRPGAIRGLDGGQDDAGED